MSDTVLMLIIFGIFAVLIVVGRVTGFLSAPREEEALAEINPASGLAVSNGVDTAGNPSGFDD